VSFWHSMETLVLCTFDYSTFKLEQMCLHVLHIVGELFEIGVLNFSICSHAFVTLFLKDDESC
jgi:hypothetical protein